MTATRAALRACAYLVATAVACVAIGDSRTPILALLAWCAGLDTAVAMQMRRRA